MKTQEFRSTSAMRRDSDNEGLQCGDCHLSVGKWPSGTIGIIGPKRMDYENVVDSLKTLKTQLDNIFKKKT